MKLTDICEGVLGGGHINEDTTNISTILTQLISAKDIDAKKSIARNMSTNFTIGDRDHFLLNIDRCRTAVEVDKLANAAASTWLISQ